MRWHVGSQGKRTVGRGKVAAVVVVALTLALAACGSSGKTTTSSSSSSAAPSTVAQTAGTGVGVTPTTIKLGVALTDYDCVKDFVDSIRVDQDKVYGAFINDINQKGGIAGRKIVPVYKSYCPIGSAGPLQVCTSLTEDENVFAVIGSFVDFSGDGQTCIANQHQRVLMTFNLTQQIMSKSPAGMIIYPGTTNERLVRVLLQLLGKKKTLEGRTVAALGSTTEANTVNTVIVPGLKQMGVKTGSSAILTVSGTDTTAALTQLDSFIERWKTEGVDTVFMSGDTVSSKSFVAKLRGAMPKVMLIVDTTDALSPAQQDAHAGMNPNPYEGVITAGGATAHEYDQSAHWKYCSTIYKQQTGKTAPNAEQVVKGPGGKTLDTYGSINDACQILSLFHDIAARVGKNLNNANWISTVNSFGAVDNKGGGPYASITKGKYDIDDSFRLEEFDSSIQPDGNWKPLTPVQRITGQ